MIRVLFAALFVACLAAYSLEAAPQAPRPPQAPPVAYDPFEGAAKLPADKCECTCKAGECKCCKGCCCGGAAKHNKKKAAPKKKKAAKVEYDEDGFRTTILAETGPGVLGNKPSTFRLKPVDGKKPAKKKRAAPRQVYRPMPMRFMAGCVGGG